MYKIYTRKGTHWRALKKILWMMKLIIAILTSTLIHVSAATFAQRISLERKQASLEAIIQEIRVQSGYNIFYNAALMDKAKPVTVRLSNVSLEEALNKCFEGQPLVYVLNEENKAVVIKEKTPALSSLVARRNDDEKTEGVSQPKTISGTVTDSTGVPLPNVTVRVKGTNTGTVTDRSGKYVLNDVPENAILTFSLLGYEPKEIFAGYEDNLTIILNLSASVLDETVVIAYGTTTQRLNTGSVGRVTASEIVSQPVSNPLAALQGRVPGLIVTQNSGVPGSGFSVQIRGRNSFDQGAQPLFLIDGVPFAANNTSVSSLASSAFTGNGGLSPFYSVNPANIESIEVLKDADATAIYGSRGANGVVLITTKKAKVGKTAINAGVFSGFSRVTRTMDMLNTQEYLTVRKEALQNDGLTPNANNAPDLEVWDTTRYTNYKNILIGGTAHTTNAQFSMSGGTANTSMLFSAGYLKETNVYPGDLPNQRGNGSFNARHSSADQRFQFGLSAGYSYAENKTATTDLTSFINLAPNTPSFYDEDGNLQWEVGGATFANPFSYLHSRYTATTGNLTGNLNLSYQLMKSLNLSASLGYNSITTREKGIYPKDASNPVNNPVSNSEFASNFQSGWIIEPQAEYVTKLWLGTLAILVGATLQENIQDVSAIVATGFSDDALMESLGSAGSISNTFSTNSQYRYGATFGRVNFNIKDTYIINLTGRRDGSSRFGPGRRFANFGAAGAAWIFTSNKFFKDNLPFLTYGKLRGSYGVTGNDQIGNYQFLDSWASYERNYSNTATLYPMGLYNPNYGWEINRKAEAAIELGFWHERLLFSTAYFNNRSGNQLVQYTLPVQTGFNSITRNFPALIQNRGWEFQLNTQNIKSNQFNWTSAFNVTIPNNKLLAFPNLETSTYRSSYVVGQPLNIIYNRQSLGVDPQTGSYHYLDVDDNGSIDLNDFVVHGTLDPKFYGGFRNTLNYKGIEADVFFEFRKRKGRNYLSSIYQTRQIPGTMYNQPVIVMDRWVEAGDITEIEKFSTLTSATTSNITNSSQAYSDASYLRLKSLAVSYSFPKSIISKIKAERFAVFAQGQNLLTFTGYLGADPETQDQYRLPPLKTYTIGVQITY